MTAEHLIFQPSSPEPPSPRPLFLGSHFLSFFFYPYIPFFCSHSSFFLLQNIFVRDFSSIIMWDDQLFCTFYLFFYDYAAASAFLKMGTLVINLWFKLFLKKRREAVFWSALIFVLHVVTRCYFFRGSFYLLI